VGAINSPKWGPYAALCYFRGLFGFVWGLSRFRRGSDGVQTGFRRGLLRGFVDSYVVFIVDYVLYLNIYLKMY
jgi:hypothetical protein